MNKAALEHLVKEIQRIQLTPLDTAKTKELLLKKYEEEENYEICELIVKYYDLINDLIDKLNSLK